MDACTAWYTVGIIQNHGNHFPSSGLWCLEALVNFVQSRSARWIFPVLLILKSNGTSYLLWAIPSALHLAVFFKLEIQIWHPTFTESAFSVYVLFQRKISDQLYLMSLSFPVVCWHCFSEGTESSDCNEAQLTSPAEAWRQNVFRREWDSTSLFILDHLNSKYSQSVWVYVFLQSITELPFTAGTTKDKATRSFFSSGVLNL